MAPPTFPRGLFLLALATLRCLLIIGRTRPKVTIGTGGYASAPACFASWLLRVPIILFLPDVEPGKAVRALLPLARRIAVTAEDSLRYVPTKKAVVTGYPVRDAFLCASRERGRLSFHIPDEATVLGVFGGSLGARNINLALARILPHLLKRYHVIHICGRDRYEETVREVSTLTSEQRAKYHLVPFLEEGEMADALAASNLVLCRSGASTLGELPATATPAVLVPLPIPGVHQRENAEYLAGRGAAVVLEDGDLESDLHDVLDVLLPDSGRLEQMAEASRALARPDAADRVAGLALEMAR